MLVVWLQYQCLRGECWWFGYSTDIREVGVSGLVTVPIFET